MYVYSYVNGTYIVFNIILFVNLFHQLIPTLVVALNVKLQVETFSIYFFISYDIV